MAPPASGTKSLGRWTYPEYELTPFVVSQTLVTFLYEILAPLNFFERTVVMFLGGETKDWADAAATKASNKRV